MFKKMFKILLVYSMIILLSGCTVTYNLKISDNVMTEKITLTEKKNLVDQKVADEQLESIFSEVSENNFKKYSVVKKEKDDNINYSLGQVYYLDDIDSVNNIRIMKDCFDAYNIVYSDDEETSLILQTSKGFHCLNYDYNEVDSVNIKIEVENEVISNNADSIDGNIYKWHIDKDNYSDKYISLEFKKNINNNSTKENVSSKTSINFKYVILFVVIFVGIIVLVLLYAMGLNKKRNKL